MEKDTDTQVEVMASLGMTVQQIADFIGISHKDLKDRIEDGLDSTARAYRRGKAMLEAELSFVIRQQAMNGDSTAIGRLQEKLRRQTQSEQL